VSSMCPQEVYPRKCIRCVGNNTGKVGVTTNAGECHAGCIYIGLGVQERETTGLGEEERCVGEGGGYSPRRGVLT
jgi:hypothetical protein